jgi:heme A synthase
MKRFLRSFIIYIALVLDASIIISALTGAIEVHAGTNMQRIQNWIVALLILVISLGFWSLITLVWCAKNSKKTGKVMRLNEGPIQYSTHQGGEVNG